VNGSSIGRVKLSRKLESMRKLPVPKIFPDVIRSRGSKIRLISRIAPSNSSPSWSRMYSVRAMPTPCSAESEPLNSFTSAEVWSATWPKFFSNLRCYGDRAQAGTCKSPLAAMAIIGSFKAQRVHYCLQPAHILR